MWWRSSILFAFLPLACGTGSVPASKPESPTSASRPEPAEPVVRHALLWTNAFVYATASMDGPKARIHSYPDNARLSHIGEVWPVEILDDEGELIRVRTLGLEDAEHCYRGPSFLNAFSLTLYVARSDLAPVLERSVAASFEDGTWVALRAGVAVDDDGTHAKADDLRFALPPGARVSRSYRHDARFDLRAAKQQTRTELRLNGLAVAEDALTSAPVSGVEVVANGARVTVLSACAQAVAQAATEPQLVPHEPVDARDAATPAAPKSAKHFAIGTKVYFPSGGEAGETVDAIAMSLLERRGQRLCFQRSLAERSGSAPIPEHHTFELCVDAAAAREKAQPRAIWPVPTTPPLPPPG